MADAQWYRVGDLDLLSEGEVSAVMAGEQAVCLVRYAGRYYALDDTCPHEGGSLGEGFMQDGCVVCPVHGWEFSPIDGHMPDYWMQPPTTAFPVEERADGVYVQC